MDSNAGKEKRFSDLVNFLTAQTGAYDVLINGETLLEDDLGVTGDDAEHLIIAFGKRYSVNVNDFYFTKYFNDEPGMFNTLDRIVAPFTVGHLEKAITAGRLDEEIKNS